jgi:esterase/lipase superfamily enzyme
MNFMLAIFAVLAVALSGCAGKPSAEVLVPANAPASTEKSVVVLAATTRERAKDSSFDFTSNRSGNINYQEYAISIPPNHLAGKIEWPSQTPGNAQTDFVVISNRRLTKSGFGKAIETQLASHRDLHGSVSVFVHGYNTNHQEAVFRVAELKADLRSTAGTMVVFSWPSRASVTGYVADRESVTYSRDYLERVLNEIARVPNVRSINLIAHSMGNWLAVETLRQAKFREGAPFLRKLGEVVLLAPDIDVDVFRTQLDAIGKLNHPIIVAVSKDDKALAASQRIAGDVPRVGNVLIDNPRVEAAIEHYGIDVVDLSQVSSSDYFGHSKFVEALPELQSIAASGGGAGNRTIGGAGVFVLTTAGKILSAPAVIGDALQQ